MESHHLQVTGAIISQDKHRGFYRYSSPGHLIHSECSKMALFLEEGSYKITEGGPLGPRWPWPICRINQGLFSYVRLTGVSHQDVIKIIVSVKCMVKCFVQCHV